MQVPGDSLGQIGMMSRRNTARTPNLNFSLKCVACHDMFHFEPGRNTEGYPIDKRPVLNLSCFHSTYCMDCFHQHLAVEAKHLRWFPCPHCRAKKSFDRSTIKANLWLCWGIMQNQNNNPNHDRAVREEAQAEEVPHNSDVFPKEQGFVEDDGQMTQTGGNETMGSPSENEEGQSPKIFTRNVARISKRPSSTQSRLEHSKRTRPTKNTENNKHVPEVFYDAFVMDQQQTENASTNDSKRTLPTTTTTTDNNKHIPEVFYDAVVMDQQQTENASTNDSKRTRLTTTTTTDNSKHIPEVFYDAVGMDQQQKTNASTKAHAATTTVVDGFVPREKCDEERIENWDSNDEELNCSNGGSNKKEEGRNSQNEGDGHSLYFKEEYYVDDVGSLDDRSQDQGDNDSWELDEEFDDDYFDSIAGDSYHTHDDTQDFTDVTEKRQQKTEEEEQVGQEATANNKKAMDYENDRELRKRKHGHSLLRQRDQENMTTTDDNDENLHKPHSSPFPEETIGFAKLHGNNKRRKSTHQILSRPVQVEHIRDEAHLRNTNPHKECIQRTPNRVEVEFKILSFKTIISKAAGLFQEVLQNSNDPRPTHWSLSYPRRKKKIQGNLPTTEQKKKKKRREEFISTR